MHILAVNTYVLLKEKVDFHVFDNNTENKNRENNIIKTCIYMEGVQHELKGRKDYKERGIFFL